MKINDTNIYTPDPVIVKLRAGDTYTDPIFGTTIRRVTVADEIEDIGYGDGRKCWSCQVEYSAVTPFNSDSSLFLIMHGSSGFAVYDRYGYFLIYPKIDGRYEVSPSSEPRWSATDPNTFYYLHGNELKTYNLNAGKARVVRKFDIYIDWTPDQINGVRGLGEQDLSESGRWYGLCGQRQDGAYEIFIYDFEKDRVSPGIYRGTKDFDNIQVSPSGLLVLSGNDGEHLYTNSMDYIGRVTNSAGHQDIGRDEYGHDCLMWVDAADPIPTCMPASGIANVPLHTFPYPKHCALPLNWDMAAHVYMPRVGGVALISTYSGVPNVPPALYLNEIVIVSTDGKTVQRVCHHRSSPYGSYNQSSKATGNNDLTKILFNSSMGDLRPNYCDVYMIDLPKSVEKPAPSPSPSPVTVTGIPGWTPTNFSGAEGKEWLIHLKVVDGKLTTEMYDKEGQK